MSISSFKIAALMLAAPALAKKPEPVSFAPTAPAQPTEAAPTGGIFSAGNVSFAYQVSSEPGFDFLKFYIDGVEKLSVSGQVTWQTTSFPITAGMHVLKWAYIKDESVGGGRDTAWIDSVVLPSVTLQMLANVVKAGTGTAAPVVNEIGWRVIEFSNCPPFPVANICNTRPRASDLVASFG